MTSRHGWLRSTAEERRRLMALNCVAAEHGGLIKNKEIKKVQAA